MPRDALGNYTLPVGNPVVSGTSISSTVHNNTIADLAAEIQDSLSRSGKGGMTGPFSFADGSAAAPSGNFASENDTGFYRSGAQEWALSVFGSRVWKAMIVSGSRVMSFVTGLFRSEVADGANSAFTFDTDAAKSNANFKLLRLANGGSVKVEVDKDGITTATAINTNQVIAQMTTSTNGTAGQFGGNGLGSGVIGVGGDSNGDGVVGVGGTTNGKGVVGTGTGTGTGVEGTGGASNAAGVAGKGGATDGVGVLGDGTGSGAGLVGSSDSGPGAVLFANATRGSLRLVPQSAEPSTPEEGDMYIDSDTHVLRIYLNSGWRTVTHTP